jgi:hypothetical protein
MCARTRAHIDASRDALLSESFKVHLGGSWRKLENRGLDIPKLIPMSRQAAQLGKKQQIGINKAGSSAFNETSIYARRTAPGQLN